MNELQTEQKGFEPAEMNRTLALQTDQELISDCLMGNAQAWEILIERYRPLIYAIPLRQGFSESDAADIFQSTCIKLLEKLSELRDQEKLRSWLITVVMRQCWKVRRRQRQEPSITSLLDDDDDNFGLTAVANRDQADEWLIKLEDQYLVQEAFGQLTARCQQLLGFLFYQDPPASYKEIAQATGIAFDSIGPTRARCLEKLKLLFARTARGVYQ